MSSAICLNLDQSKILSSVNGLTLPGDKVLDWSKLKAVADNKRTLAKIIIIVFDRVKNIVENVEKFSPFSCNIFKWLLTGEH